MREQRLVGSDDVLTGGERAQDEGARRLEAAHELDDDVDRRVRQHLRRVTDHRQRLEIQTFTRSDEVGVGDGRQGEPTPGALFEHRSLRGENLHDAGADGAQAQQSDSNVVDARHRGAPRLRRSATSMGGAGAMSGPPLTGERA